MESHDITYYIIRYSYLGIFIWFLIIDQLTPIPEELVLLTVGYLMHSIPIHPVFAGISAAMGLMIVDNIYYYLAFTGNKWTQRVQQKQRKLLIRKFSQELQKHQIRTLLIIAFIPKVRFFGPILAGFSKLPYKHFLLINSVGTLTYVTVYLSMGYYFHHAMELIIKKVEIYHHGIFAVFVLTMAVLISLYVNKWLSR